MSGTGASTGASTGPRALAGIQARMSSRRLPGKSLCDVDGAPLIRHVWERARAARGVEQVFVLTSTDPSDDPLARYLAEQGLPFRRGPLDDVLARYLALADEFEPRYLVRITGDCPLLCPEFIDLQVEALAAFDGDAIQVLGPSVEATLGGQSAHSVRSLRAAARSPELREPEDREHVAGFYFARHPERLRTVAVEVDATLARDDVKLTVDEPLDLEFLRALHAGWSGRIALDATPLIEVLAWLDENPEVLKRTGARRGVVESDANRAVRALRAGRDARVVGRYPAPGT